MKWLWAISILCMTNSPVLLADQAKDLTSEQLAWLAHAQQAAVHTSYSGNLVYERKGVFATYATHHLAQNHGFTQRIVRLDNAQYELLRNQEGVLCSFSETSTQTPFYLSDWPSSLASLQHIEQNYQLSWGEESRIAGRPTYSLNFAAKDSYRYSMQLKLDQQTGVPLQTLLLNNRQQLLERTQYVSFAPGQPVPSALQASANCSRQTVQQNSHSDSVWDPKWVPTGFVKVQSSVFQVAGKTNTYNRSYSDGLVHFSVFIEPNHSRVRLPEVKKSRTLGPTALVSLSGCKHVKPPVVITVIGELPMLAIERIAHSVCPKDKGLNSD